MYIPRIYQASPLRTGDLLRLDAQASHHIIHVVRLKLTSPIIIFNGAGGEFEATLKSANKREAVVLVGKYTEKNIESPLHIHLGQAICRNDKMDYIIQKAVELGVEKITPLITKHVEVKLATEERIEKRLKRWNDIIISACEQCGRNKIPTIEQLTPFENWLSNQNSEKSDYRFILTPHHGKSLSDYSDKTSSVCFLVGPESGFDIKEEQLAINHGFQPLRVGPRILRTETAALATISAMQTLWGDFS